MRINFIHSSPSYLPEITVYTEYIQAKGHETIITRKPIDEADVHWHFCGIVQGRDKSKVTVHEYASASTPPFANSKDFVKQVVNAQPDYRVFLNTFVQQRYRFRDNVPYFFRDMGIQNVFQCSNRNDQCFDLVYLGNTDRLKYFYDTFYQLLMTGLQVLIIGENNDFLKNQFGHFENLTVTGRVKHEDVVHWLYKAKIGLNFMPLKYPFIEQTSTKALEYVSVGLPVISQCYPWISNSEAINRRVTYVEDWPKSQYEWSDLVASIVHSNFAPADLNEYKWDKILENFGLFDELGL